MYYLTAAQTTSPPKSMNWNGEDDAIDYLWDAVEREVASDDDHPAANNASVPRTTPNANPDAYDMIAPLSVTTVEHPRFRNEQQQQKQASQRPQRNCMPSPYGTVPRPVGQGMQHQEVYGASVPNTANTGTLSLSRRLSTSSGSMHQHQHAPYYDTDIQPQQHRHLPPYCSRNVHHTAPISNYGYVYKNNTTFLTVS